jgi:DNA repair protein RAD50
LQEGATLKKKFDEIFDSAKYTKALEAYRKTEKELVEIAKNHKENLAALGSHKHAVEGFVAELQEQSEQEEELSAEQKDLADKISKIEKELAVYNTISDKVDAADLGIGMLKSQQSTKRAALAQLQTMMDEDLTSKYSLQELRLQLSSFGDKMKTQQDDEERFERQLALLNSKMDTHLHQREMDLKLQLGKLDAGRTAHGVNLKERLLQMESIAQTYQVDLSRVATSQSQMSAYLSSLSQGASQVDEAATQELIANLSPDDMRSFFRVLEKKEQELENNLKSHKVKAQADEDKLSNTIAELQGQVSSIESGTYAGCVGGTCKLRTSRSHSHSLTFALAQRNKALTTKRLKLIKRSKK